MKTYWINDIDTCNRCINWLKENKYKTFCMQYAWYEKKGFIMWLNNNKTEDIEIHTKTEVIQQMLLDYACEK